MYREYDEMIIRDDLINELIKIVANDNHETETISEYFEVIKSMVTELVDDVEIDVNTFYNRVVDLFNVPTNWKWVMDDLNKLSNYCALLQVLLIEYRNLFQNEYSLIYKPMIYSLLCCNVIVKNLISEYS